MSASIAKTLLLAVASTLVCSALPAQSHLVRVSPVGATPIRNAVRAARPGDTIALAAGIYREPTIVVDRPVVIEAEPGAALDGTVAAGNILDVRADGVTIRGLTLRNVGVSRVDDRAAIHVGAVSGCVIENNRVENAYFGIYLEGTTGCTVSRNQLAGRGDSENASGDGIHLWTARDVTVRDNHVTGHRDGIYLEFAHDARVVGNVSEGNVRYGLHFMYSDDCRYEGNTFRSNEAGVAVMYTKRVVMTGNRFEGNWGPAAYGLLLKEIADSRVANNEFVRNTVALVADGASRMIADSNEFSDNGWALRLMASTQDASFSGNVFVRNTFDVATNSTATTARLHANYWDEYRGFDRDRDGLGDVPHVPVRLFSLVTERTEPAMILLRSPVSALLDRTERLLPSLTPRTLADDAPLMRRPR